MGNIVARKLVFRLGEVGFSLDLSFIVEICQQVDDLLDFSYADANVAIVGALNFRNTRVPAVDPALSLDLVSRISLPDRTALILTSPEGNWALLVDRVEEISSVDKFRLLDLPTILRMPANKYYSQVELFHDEPLVCFNPKLFYATSGLAS